MVRSMAGRRMSRELSSTPTCRRLDLQQTQAPCSGLCACIGGLAWPACNPAADRTSSSKLQEYGPLMAHFSLSSDTAKPAHARAGTSCCMCAQLPSCCTIKPCYRYSPLACFTTVCKESSVLAAGC